MYKQAIFSLDFSDPTEFRLSAFHLSDQQFPQPFFTKETAEQITERQNELAKVNPEADKFEWKGEKLMWYSFSGEIKEEPVYELIPCNPIVIEAYGQQITVYPIGHGSWNWEHDEDPEIFILARVFSLTLLREIGEEALKAVIERNNAETNSNCCHSHDFCDANMTMYDAFKAVTGREHDLQSDTDMDLWNTAWTIAKQHEFFFTLLTTD